MELELGLKITTDADAQSPTDLHITKGLAGPVFVSTETDSVFILSAHLKGFEEENIKININEDGTRLMISGEKLVTETIMRGWKVYRKEKELRGFRKTFKIPDGVVLDRIKAKFGAEKSSLTIYIPKYEKGIRGHRIEEVKEQEEEGEMGATTSQDTKPKGHEKEELMKQPAEMENEETNERVGKVDKDWIEEAKQTQELPQVVKQQAQEAKPGANVQGSVSADKPAPVGFFSPSFFMGSALITSLVVLVVGLVTTKRHQGAA